MKVDIKGNLLPNWSVDKVYVVYNQDNNQLMWTYDKEMANDIALARKTDKMMDIHRTYIDEVSSKHKSSIATVSTLEEFHNHFRDRKDIVDNAGIQMQSQYMIALI